MARHAVLREHGITRDSLQTAVSSGDDLFLDNTSHGGRLGTPASDLPLDMPLTSLDESRWRSTLAHHAPEGAGPEQIADGIAVVWLGIDRALHPVIGMRGVVALFDRSLHVTAATFPWIADNHQRGLPALDCAALKAAVRRQTPVEAAAGGLALFTEFHDLLASLVGPSLTVELLRSVWTQPSGAAPAQDTSQ